MQGYFLITIIIIPTILKKNIRSTDSWLTTHIRSFNTSRCGSYTTSQSLYLDVVKSLILGTIC